MKISWAPNLHHKETSPQWLNEWQLLVKVLVVTGV